MGRCPPAGTPGTARDGAARRRGARGGCSPGGGAHARFPRFAGQSPPEVKILAKRDKENGRKGLYGTLGVPRLNDTRVGPPRTPSVPQKPLGSEVRTLNFNGFSSPRPRFLPKRRLLRRRFSNNRRNFEELFVENKTRKFHILKIAI